MEIRRIEAKAVTDTVKELFLRCNYEIGQDILDALAQAREREPSALGREVLGQLLENDRIAAPDLSGYGHGVFICGIRRQGSY